LCVGEEQHSQPDDEQHDKDSIACRYEFVAAATAPKSSGPIHDVPRSEIS